MEQARLETKPSLELERHFPVAPEKVWRAWTDPETLKRWWGPGERASVSLAQIDLRPGGRFRIVFGGPQGNDHEVQGVYKEVVPNRKLVFTWTWPRTTPERESLVTVQIRPDGEGTSLTLIHEQFFDEAARDGHERGWTVTFGKLEAFLQTA